MQYRIRHIVNAIIRDPESGPHLSPGTNRISPTASRNPGSYNFADKVIDA